MYLVRTLASNKTRGHALAVSLDASPTNEDVDLYSVIENGDLSVSEQVYNNYLIDATFKVMKKKLNILEQNIIGQYLIGYSYEEIAQLLNISKKKIDNTVQKYKRVVANKKIF